MLSPNRSPSFYPLVRYASLALSLSVLVWSAGCSKGAKDVVSGKVTLNGSKGVAGTVYFVGPDKKTTSGPISPDGTYRIENPSRGENVVLVKSEAGVPGAAKKDQFTGKAGVAKDLDLKDKFVSADMGQPPPQKYATDAGGLKFNVTGGKQTYNIDLQP